MFEREHSMSAMLFSSNGSCCRKQAFSDCLYQLVSELLMCTIVISTCCANMHVAPRPAAHHHLGTGFACIAC